MKVMGPESWRCAWEADKVQLLFKMVTASAVLPVLLPMTTHYMLTSGSQDVPADRRSNT